MTYVVWARNAATGRVVSRKVPNWPVACQVMLELLRLGLVDVGVEVEA